MTRLIHGPDCPSWHTSPFDATLADRTLYRHALQITSLAVERGPLLVNKSCPPDLTGKEFADAVRWAIKVGLLQSVGEGWCATGWGEFVVGR